MSEIVIFDTEYTTWDGAQTRAWTGENEYREVVQIGALKVEWPSGNVIDSLDILIKPSRNPKLSDYFIKLTGITQEQVDRSGIPFAEALKFFLDFCGPRGTVVAFGNDAGILAENIALNHCHPHHYYGRDAVNFISARPAFMAADPSVLEKGIASGKLWEHFGLPRPHEDMHEHNALFDCYSILAGLKHLKHRKMLGI